MKTRIAALVLALVLILAAPLLVMAQDPVTTVNVLGVELEVTALDAIVAILGGGLITLIVQLLKKKVTFIAEGVGAFVFTVFLTGATSAFYFLVVHPMSPWDWLKYAVYTAAVLGDSTGWFHLYKKVSGTPSTP